MSDDTIPATTVACPHCGAARDTRMCTTGDALYCGACDHWSTVRHQDGGVTVLVARDAPPTSWTRRSGKARKP